MPQPQPLPRIGLISDQRFPHTDADTQQIMKSALALKRAGVDLELIISPRRGRVLWPRARRLRELATYYGLSEVGHIRPIPGLPAGDRRLPAYLAHGLLGSAYAALRGIEVVYTRDPLPALLCLALGKRLIFETYRTLDEHFGQVAGLVARLVDQPRFVGVITHSAFAAGSFRQAGVPPERLLVAHNGFDPEDMEPRRTVPEARRMLGLEPDVPLVVYTGNMQPNKNLPVVIDIAARVPEAEFLMVGGRPEQIRALRGHARKIGAHNMRFLGSKPVTEIPDYLYAADVLIVPPTSKPLYQHGRAVLPIKTFSYLAAGRAILAPDLPDIGELLVDGQNARLVGPDDPATAADALRELLGDAELRRRLSAAALETAAGLTWDARGRRIRAWLEERLGSPAS